MYKKYLVSLISIITVIILTAGCGKIWAVKEVNNGKSATSGEVANSVSPSPTDNLGAQQVAGEVKDNKKIEPQKDANKSIAPEKQDEGSQEVKSSGKTIVIDPGHGGKVTSEKEAVSPDSNELKPKNVEGATGVSTRTPEHVIALNVSMKLKALLEKDGYKVIMTRTTSTESIGNIARAEIGNKNNADLVIRIHADSTDSSSVKGASMLVPGNVGYAKSISSISKQYGQIILKELISNVGMNNRGVVTRNDLTGFNWSKVPVVLIEMGFLSNPDEDKLLSSDSYEQKIAVGLEKGIVNALNK